MKTKLFKTKIFAFIVVFIEMAALIFFGVCYGLNLLNFRNVFTTELIFLILGAIVIFDIVFCWALIFRFSRIRQKSDLRAADLIGSDIQEAYNFGMLGLVVTDDNDIVLWTNTLFTDRKIEIINTNILDWHKDLLPLKDPNFSEESVKIIINSRNYEVKYLAEAGLWIFKDTTEFESI